VTRLERLSAIDAAVDDAMRHMSEDRCVSFSDACRKAVIGAAFLLNRDPEALAELLIDGRMAEYIEAAGTTLPLSLDEPSTELEPVDELIASTVVWLEAEKERLDRQIHKIRRRFDRTAADLRQRSLRSRRWRDTWLQNRPYPLSWRQQRGIDPQCE
jgi:hypothetical protein